VNRNRSQPQSHPPQPIPESAAELEGARVIERPDGFWVQPEAGGHEFGPYATLVEAIESYRAEDEEELEPGGTLAEVEADLGVSDWIDPETSAPAEDRVPHIEDH
jgi:hypothetical protein